MERDRQGVDPRFSVIPAPLDVYLFIWDRTRMVRKDFILQNYVGTGGNCDARAVRCHERIARWHAACEHQLSHIPDFVKMQSQQNIAEMGQAMKTLNLFYDDSLQRSTLDEIRDKKNEYCHGCASNIVMGVDPVDFDGKLLRNDEREVTKRIIGNTGVSNGTAEPEMRALYILLTLENDGGMEVLKYAAKLSSERPEVFHSKPVQLALEIFKVTNNIFFFVT
jgi:SAC3/GANP family